MCGAKRHMATWTNPREYRAATRRYAQAASGGGEPIGGDDCESAKSVHLFQDSIDATNAIEISDRLISVWIQKRSHHRWLLAAGWANGYRDLAIDRKAEGYPTRRQRFVGTGDAASDAIRKGQHLETAAY